jgi:hypothetical protein
VSFLKERKQMANIGTTTAFYKVETSLSRANSEVSKSMERLATGKQNANAGDRSSYVAMADTFRLDFVGTKAGLKGGLAQVFTSPPPLSGKTLGRGEEWE